MSMVGLRKLILLSFCATYLIGQGGCVAASASRPLSLSETDRTGIETIRVESARVLPDARFETQAAGPLQGITRGAQAGAQLGALTGGLLLLVLCTSPNGIPHPYCLPVVPAAAIVGSLPGAVYGAVAAESSETVAKAETALKQALANLRIQEAFQGRVLKEARRKTTYSFVVLTEQNPTVGDGKRDEAALGGRPIDTGLTLSVLSLELRGGVGLDPPLRLSMTTQVRLHTGPDHAVVYDYPFTYQSESAHTFKDWVVNDVQPFLEELDRAYEKLAEHIVYELFVFSPLPSREVAKGYCDREWRSMSGIPDHCS